MRNKVVIISLVMLTVLGSLSIGFTATLTPTNKEELASSFNPETESLNSDISINSSGYSGGIEALSNDLFFGSILSNKSDLLIRSLGGMSGPYYTPDPDVWRIEVDYNTTQAEVDQVNTKITEEFSSGGAIYTDINTNGETEFDAIYNYITNLPNTPSATDDSNGQVAYDLLFVEGGVCAAYSDLGSKMLDYAGIPNKIELGLFLKSDRTAAIPHAWNLVDLGSGYQVVDFLNYQYLDQTSVYSKEEMLNGTIPESGIVFIRDASNSDFKLAYDNGNPTMTLTHENDKITIASSDTGSIKSGPDTLTLPDGSEKTIESSGITEYIIDSNGTYEFTVTDKSGKSTTDSIEVTNFVGQTYDYTVTFLDDLGNELKTESVIDGESASSPIPPTYNDRIFNGWDVDFSNVTSDLTVTALYANKHAVEFLNHNNEVVAIEYVADGEDCPIPDYTSTRLGYSFDGWDGNLTDITSDIQIHATYIENTTGHTVTFTANGIEINSQTVNDGEDAIEPTNIPDVSGEKFTGWDKPLTNITTDTAITAIYEERTYYTIDFNVNGGNPIDSVAYEDIEGVPTLPTPAKDGYEFVEWQLNGSSYNTGNKLTKDITLDAVWSELAKDEFIVTLNGDSAEFENETFTVVDGDTFNTNVVPTKCNSEFIEWQLNDESVTFPLTITESITLTAVYEYLPKEVFIYPNNGEVYEPLDNMELLYETQLPELEKDGFEFSHWELNDVKITEFPVTINETSDVHAVWTEVDNTPIVEEPTEDNNSQEDNTPVEEEPTDNSEDNTSNEEDNTPVVEEPTEEVDNTPTPPPTNNETSDNSGSSGGSSGGSFVPPPILAMEDSEETPEEERKKEQETLLLKAKESTSVRNIFESIDAYEIDEDEFVETLVESLSKNEALSKDEEDKALATEIVKNIINSKKTQSKKDKLLAELNYYKIKDENLKKDLTKTVQNNMLKLEKTEDFVEAMDELSQIDEEVDKVTDTEVADVLKLKIKTNMDKSPTESLGELEEKKTTKAIESIINTNKDFDFFNNLRAETYIEQLEDEELKTELKSIHNSVKSKHRDKPIVPIKREATPPIIIDGRETSFQIKNNDGTTEDVKPFIKDGRTLSSVRVIAETLDTDVSWDGSTQSIVLTKGDTYVKMQINNNIMYINSKPVEMDIKPIIKDSRSYFPARFIAESLGSIILWNEEYNTVFID